MVCKVRTCSSLRAATTLEEIYMLCFADDVVVVVVVVVVIGDDGTFSR